MSPVAAARRSRRAATSRRVEHDENFPVAFPLLPRELRADMFAIYRFCRTVDDIGDGQGDAGTGDLDTAGRLAALDAFELDVHRCWDGTPASPVLQALATTVRRHAMDPDPFLRLIEANRIDQRQTRWETYADLIHYCRHSATPVGEMVLAVLGHRDAERLALSDHTCIGLQLVNFWQDIRRDLVDNGRIYLPREDRTRFGVDDDDDLRQARAGEATRRLVAFEVARARAELVAGAPLAAMVTWRARLDLRTFTAGGIALCDAIARQDYDTLRSRPAPGRLGRARIALDVLLGMMRR